MQLRDIPMVDFYIAHAGPVKISSYEAQILEIDRLFERLDSPLTPNRRAIMVRAEAIRRDANRVAAWKASH